MGYFWVEVGWNRRIGKDRWEGGSGWCGLLDGGGGVCGN